MILIDTDAAVLDEADIYDGDLQFECDTAAGSKRIVISLAPNQALDLDDAARWAQVIAEAHFGVGGNGSARYDGPWINPHW